MQKVRFLEDFVNHWVRILYHITIAGLSAAIALSLPWTLNLIGKKVLIYWSLLENEKLLVVAIEMVVAVLLIFFFNIMGRSWKDRRLSNMAKDGGLVLVKPAKGFLSRRQIKNMKEKQGFAKDVQVIGSTGFRSFTDPEGDLHQVMLNCRKAEIMLLNPFSEGARVRVESIHDPHITTESFHEQIKKSIIFLKELKAVKKEVKLKFYQDTPLLKLAILDDYIWVQHYHSGLDIQQMPEYVFKHDQNLDSLFIPFYQFFMAKWKDPSVPEYDLEGDMLVYRDISGNEIKREQFGDQKAKMSPRSIPDHPLAPEHGHGYPYG
jgi:hypothetical protein